MGDLSKMTMYSEGQHSRDHACEVLTCYIYYSLEICQYISEIIKDEKNPGNRPKIRGTLPH